MKGKTRIAFALVVLSLVLGSFLVFASTTEAQPEEQQETNPEASAKTYSACGGVQGCRSSCGCGCGGNPALCGCGG